MKVALYARVSTSGQTVDNQLRELRGVAERRGWKVVHEYVDRGISGKNGRDRRPAYDEVRKAATRGDIDLVAAWSVDRLGRSLADLAGFLTELRAAGAGLYLHKQGLDSTTPSGRAMFQMAGVFAEFERELIVERTRAGLERARAQGRTLGRPRTTQAVEKKVRQLRAKGLGLRETARRCGVGHSVVRRLDKETCG